MPLNPKDNLPLKSRIILPDDARITIERIQLVLQIRESQLPAKRSRQITIPTIVNTSKGRNLGDTTFRSLFIGKIADGLRVKLAHIVVIHESVGGNHHIGPITHFLPARAIGLHAEYIAEKCPLNHFVQFVEHFIGAFKRAGIRDIGVKANTEEIINCWRSRPAGNLHVAKTMKGEARPPFFDALPFERVAVLLPGRLRCAGTTLNASFFICVATAVIRLIRPSGKFLLPVAV